ncbi:MAG: hypothetical protein FWD49_01590 [Firmicutes bacterium]|nr:hypothetical protein [Bacillota bacterium]
MSQRISTKAKNIAYIAVVAVMIVALVTSAFVSAFSRGIKPKGRLNENSIGNYNFRYSEKTREEFRDNFRTWIVNALVFFGEERENIQDIPLDLLGAREIILALERANIGADKAIRFSKYFESRENPFEIDFTELILYSGITFYEMGAFLYEHQLLIANEEDKALLTQLGRARYIGLIADPFEIYEEFNFFYQKNGATPAEARMAHAMLYTQGSKFNDILNTFGADNVEKLFGIGYDLIDINLIDIEDENYEQLKLVNALSKELSGMVGYFMRVSANIMINLELNAFYALADFLNTGEDSFWVFATLTAISTGLTAHQTALQEFNLTEEEVISKISSYFAHARLIELNGEGDLNALKQEETANAWEMFALLKQLGALEFTSHDTILNLSESEFAEITNNLNVFLNHYNRLEYALSVTASIVVYSVLLRAVATAEAVIKP